MIGAFRIGAFVIGGCIIGAIVVGSVRGVYDVVAVKADHAQMKVG
jgi:hypothetical protein